MRFAFLILLTACAGTPALPSGGHSHNDYRRDRPLHDALQAGMASIEADVHLVGGRLLIGHDEEDLDPSRDLATLYLDPLEKRVRENEGSVYGDGRELLLLVDQKSAALPTWQALEALLARYDALVSQVRDGHLRRRAVRIVVSGNRPLLEMRAASLRRSSIDGRLADLHSQAETALIPLVSDSWNQHFGWKGRGAIPEAERIKLEALATSARKKGYLFRLWGSPDTPAAWKALTDAGVTLINTDRPRDFQRFAESRAWN